MNKDIINKYIDECIEKLNTQEQVEIKFLSFNTIHNHLLKRGWVDEENYDFKNGWECSFAWDMKKDEKKYYLSGCAFDCCADGNDNYEDGIYLCKDE